MRWRCPTAAPAGRGGEEEGEEGFDDNRLADDFHALQLSLEGCKYGVPWPQEAPITQVVEDLRTLDPSIKIGFHSDIGTIDRSVKGKAAFSVGCTPEHVVTKYTEWKSGDGKDKELKAVHFRRVVGTDGQISGYDVVFKPRANAGEGAKLAKKDAQLTLVKSTLIVRVPLFVYGVEEDEVDQEAAPGARALVALFGASAVLDARWSPERA